MTDSLAATCDTERLAFESWLFSGGSLGAYPPRRMTRTGRSGGYENEAVDLAWRAWRQARKVEETPVPLTAEAVEMEIRHTAQMTSLGERFVSGYLNDASIYHALMFCAEQIQQIRGVRGEIPTTGGLREVTAIPVVFNRQTAPKAGDRCIRCCQEWVEVPGSGIGHICRLGSPSVKSSVSVTVDGG